MGNGLPAEAMKDFATDPTNPTRLYVLSKNALYRSEDGGASFSQSYKGKEDVEIEGTAVDAKGNAYVGTREGVLRSSDGGKTWSAFNDGLTNNDVRALYCAGTRLYAGTAAGGVFSIDLQ